MCKMQNWFCDEKRGVPFGMFKIFHEKKKLLFFRINWLHEDNFVEKDDGGGS